MKTSKVSVILPCYNVAKFMEPMFTSLRNQTMKDIEIICVDDKSTDDTIKKIRDFIKSDNRIRLYKLNKNTPRIAKSTAIISDRSGNFL